MTRTLTSLLVPLMAFTLAGCASRPDDEAETAEQRVAQGAGYYEVEHQGKRYVVGSAEAAQNVKDGKLPNQTVHRFSAGGKQVLIDADDPAIRYRLEHEYDRRHGSNIKF